MVTGIGHTRNPDRLGRPRVLKHVVCWVGLSRYLLGFHLLKQALASAANSLKFCSLGSELTFGVDLVYGY